MQVRHIDIKYFFWLLLSNKCNGERSNNAHNFLTHKITIHRDPIENTGNSKQGSQILGLGTRHLK